MVMVGRQNAKTVIGALLGVLVVIALGGVLSLSWALPAHGQPFLHCNEARIYPSSYTVDEGAGSVRLGVRGGGEGLGYGCMSGSVDYETIRDEAQPGEDYEHTSGTLTFHGEDEKHISIEIFEDSLVEGQETFWVLLSNPQDGMRIDSGSAAVEIVDNDGESVSSQSRSTSAADRPSSSSGESVDRSRSEGSSGEAEITEPARSDTRTIADRAPTAQGVGIAGEPDDAAPANAWTGGALVAAGLAGGLVLFAIGWARRTRLHR